MSKLLVIEEYHEGEYELRGERYTSVVIFDLEKLNQISKNKIESSLLEKWKKETPDIEPMNGVDYSFEDIQEEIECGEYDSIEDCYNGELNIFTIDLSEADKEKMKRFESIIYNNNNETDSVYFEVLNELFSNKELNTASLSIEDLGIKKLTTYSINLNDVEYII